MKLTSVSHWDDEKLEFVGTTDSGEEITVSGEVFRKMLQEVGVGGPPLKPEGEHKVSGFSISHRGRELIFSFRVLDGTAGNFLVRTYANETTLQSAAETIEQTMVALLRAQ